MITMTRQQLSIFGDAINFCNFFPTLCLLLTLISLSLLVKFYTKRKTLGSSVAEQRVTGLKRQGCAVWVKNQERKSRLISPPLLMSGGGFNLYLRIRKDGYAWAAWRMVVCLGG